jgi:hypothetical protein
MEFAMVRVATRREPRKRVRFPRSDLSGIEQTRLMCATIIMLDAMRRGRGINPHNGNSGPHDGFMRMIIGRPMFHPDRFIHKFGSRRDGT